MEYIHNNPSKKYPFLYPERSDYPYSSACYYDLGVDAIIEIDDLNDFMDHLAD